MGTNKNNDNYWPIFVSAVLLVGCGARSELAGDDIGAGDSGAIVAGAGGGGGNGVGGQGAAGAGLPGCEAGSNLGPIFDQPDVTTVAVVADGERVFFTAESDLGGAVYASDRNGDGLIALATNQQDPWAIAEHDDRVYWVDDSARVMTAPKDGGEAPVTLFADTSLGHLVADDTHVYVSGGGGGGRIWRIDVVNKTPAVFVDLDQQAPGALAIDQTHLYFLTTEPQPNGKSRVFRAAKSGGEPELIASGGNADDYGVTMLMVDANSLYWSASKTGQVLRVGKDGGDVSILVEGVTATSLAQTSNHIYFTAPYSSDDEIRRIWRAGKPHGLAVPIVETTQYNPWSIAVDEDYLFFTSRVTTGPLTRACR